LGYVLKTLGTVFVDPKRIKRTRQSIDAGVRRGNRHLIIFPEGKRSSDGSIRKFQRGFAYILRNSTLDLLPITANGFYTLKPANRIYLDPFAELEVIIHPAISNSQIRGMTDEMLVTTVESLVGSEYQP
jgi:1-acyl-sn-glycerol-3-phosphate acyltransferase